MSLDHQILVCIDNDNGNDDNVTIEVEDEPLVIEWVDTSTDSLNKPKPSSSSKRKRRPRKTLQYLTCQPCGIAFSTYDGYHSHLQNCGHKDEITIVECTNPGCSMIFGGEKDLAMHLKYDHRVKSGFSKRRIVKNPLDVEESMELAVPQVQQSNHEHSSSSNTKPSVGIKDNKYNYYRCPRCSLTFSNKTSLYRHKKRCTRASDLVECRNCNLFFTKYLYEKHLSKKTCGQKKVYHECSQHNCNKSFIRYNHLWDHLRYEHGLFINVEKLSFKNMEEFYAWKNKEDREKFVRSINSGGRRVHYSSGITYHYYYCVFSSVRRRGPGNYRIPNTSCPARLIVKETKEGVFLTYYPFHNHKLDATNTRYFHNNKTSPNSYSKKEESCPQLSSGAKPSDQTLNEKLMSVETTENVNENTENVNEDSEKQDCIYIIVESPSEISCTESGLQTSTENILQTSTDNVLQTSMENSLQTSIENTLQTSTDNTLQTSTENILQTSTENILQTFTENTLQDSDKTSSLVSISNASFKHASPSDSVHACSPEVSTSPISSKNILPSNSEQNNSLQSNPSLSNISPSITVTCRSPKVSNDNSLKNISLSNNPQASSSKVSTSNTSLKNIPPSISVTCISPKVSTDNTSSKISSPSSCVTHSSPKVKTSRISSQISSSKENAAKNVVDKSSSVLKKDDSPSSSSVNTNNLSLKNDEGTKSGLQISVSKTLLQNYSLNKSVPKNSSEVTNSNKSLNSVNLKKSSDDNIMSCQNSSMIKNLMKDHDYTLEDPVTRQKKFNKARQQLELKLIELMRLIVLEEIRPLIPHIHSVLSDLCKEAEGCLQVYEKTVKHGEGETSRPIKYNPNLITSKKSVNTRSTKNVNEDKKNLINISKRSNETCKLENRLSVPQPDCSLGEIASDDETDDKKNGNISSNSDLSLNHNKRPSESLGNNAKRSVRRSGKNLKCLSEPYINNANLLSEKCNDFKIVSKQSSDNVENTLATSPNDDSSDTIVRKQYHYLRSGKGLSFTRQLNVEKHANMIMNVGTQQLNFVHLKSIDIYISDKEVSKLTEMCQVFRKGWLFDCVITAFLEIAARKSKDVIVVDPAITYLVAHGIDYTQAFPKFKLAPENTLLIPLNLHNGHWALMVAKLFSREIIFFDPKKGMDVHGYGHFIKPWLEIFNKTACSLHTRARDDWTLVQPQRMLQTDSHSCGVYVCWYGHQYLHNKSYIEPFHPDVYRKLIYDTIVRHADSTELNNSDSEE